MVLKEGYIARWKKYPKDEVKIRVAPPSILSPSKELLADYKNGLINWKGYEEKFREEIFSNFHAMTYLRSIKSDSEKKDVKLICYEKNPPFHRFILMNIISKLDKLKA